MQASLRCKGQTSKAKAYHNRCWHYPRWCQELVVCLLIGFARASVHLQFPVLEQT